MFKSMQRMHQAEEGITALETAIILIAFVVVASVFAFTVLSAGITTTEKGKEAVFAGLAEVRGSMEPKGNLIALSSDNTTIDTIIFVVANSAGGEAIDLTVGANKKMIVDYRDSTQRVTDLPWTKRFLGANDADDLLEPGEQAEITIPLTVTLGINTVFALESRPPRGSTLVMERTTPAYLDAVMDLH